MPIDTLTIHPQTQQTIFPVNSIPDPVGSDSEWEQAHRSVTKRETHSYSIYEAHVLFHQIHTLSLSHSTEVGHCRYKATRKTLVFPFCHWCSRKKGYSSSANKD